MKKINNSIGGVLVAFLLLASVQLNAQINTPRASLSATVSQTVGVSTISIDYSRPSVRGRQIYGTPIVHYGFQNLGFGTSKAAPWRAGANENTRITFSHDMTIEGKSIKAGTYGLHIAVEEGNTATLVLSHNSTSWGSYFYDESEDALRATMKVTEVPNTELLTYSFDDVTSTAATVVLKWEKKAFSFTVDVPVAEIVLNEIRNGMRDQPGFNRQTWEQAAGYALNNGGDLKEALEWINGAMEGQFFSQKTFANSQIKAAILAKMGKNAEAVTIMENVLDQGTVLELHQYGRQLIGSGDTKKAMEIFEFNAKKNKGVWPTHYGLARGYSAEGDYKTALKHLEKALANAPNPGSKGNVSANIEKLKKGENIN